MNRATIFNIQRFSLQDGPGIRTTVFLKGCPLHCSWCHNPESMDPRPEPMLKVEHCLSCELCTPVCKEGLTGNLAQVGHPDERCTRCGQCVAVCPTEARQMSGRLYPVPELIEEVRRDEVYHHQSRGGVTFSGGEPLTVGNAPFVLQSLAELSRHGIHTAVDTCGQVSSDLLLHAASLADLILYDLKIMDSKKHQESTGTGNERIHENLHLLMEKDTPVWVRVPLIPGHTNDEENLDAMADFLMGLPRRPRVSLLPFHATGGDKYGRLGLDNKMNNIPSMTAPQLRLCQDYMRARGLEVEE